MTPAELAIRHVHGDEDRSLRRLLKNREAAPPGAEGTRVITMAPIALEQYRLLYRYEDRATDLRGFPIRTGDRYIVIRTLWERAAEVWTPVDWTPLQTVKVREGSSDVFGPVGPSRPGRFGAEPEVAS